MDIIMRWVKHSSLLVKMTMAISLTSAFVVTQKMLYKPYVKRSRLLQAEEWANTLIEQEEKQTEYDIS